MNVSAERKKKIMKIQKENLKFKDMNEEMLKLLMSIERELGEIKATGLSTLAQATKTNGRVTCLEKTNEELSKIVSRHNGVLMKWEKNEEGAKELKLEKSKQWISFQGKAIWVVIAIILAYLLGDYPQVLDFIKNIVI